MPRYKKLCVVCGKVFSCQRSHAKTCSASCRVSWHHLNRICDKWIDGKVTLESEEFDKALDKVFQPLVKARKGR